MIITTHHDYLDETTTLKGYYAYDDANSVPKPAILIAPDWTGVNEFARKKAESLAELGYVGFALDMYGEGKTGKTKEEKSALMQPFAQDRTKLLKRISAAFTAVKQLSIVDKTRIGAIGFCFGGMCVLDLARSGVEMKGVVSFHGLLNAPNHLPHTPIKASILALHGYDDPMGPPEAVNAFAQEMTHAKADWQMHIYGSTMHAFTNPEANDPGFGTVYNKKADNRSWQAMKDFFAEVL